jgi:hypothetical protein
MSNHANFASVVVLKQTFIQEALRIYHNFNLIPSSVSGTEEIVDPTQPTGTPPTRLDYNLFLDVPRITISASSPLIGVALRLTGRATVQPMGSASIERQIVIEGSARITPQILLTNSTVQVGLDFSFLLLDSLTLRVISGPALPDREASLINSSLGRLYIQGRLRERLGTNRPLTPELFTQITSVMNLLGLRFKSPTEEDPQRAFLIKTFDGAIGVGVNLESDGRHGLVTTGVLDDFYDFTGSSSMATSIHPELAWVLFAYMQGITVVQARLQANVSIDCLRFTFEPGNLHVQGNATQGGISAGFSLRTRPRLTESRVGIDIYDFNLHSLPWWFYLIHIAGVVIMAPVITPILLSVMGSISANISNQLESGVEGAVAGDRMYVFTLPGTDYPPCRLTIDDLAIGADGLDGRSSLRPLWRRASYIEGPESLSPDRLGALTYRLITATGVFHPADPYVRIRWEVRRLDTSAVILTRDVPVMTTGSTEISFDNSSPELSTSWGFSIYCRLYRTIGAATEEFFGGTLRLGIYDRLNRSRPYVRWSHGVYTPQVRVTYEGGRRALSYEGTREVERTSKIHRTAIPGRCRFADKYSRWVLPAPDPRAPGMRQLEYLNELPFPTSELLANRRQVCDYCFFGGPDKNVPLI